MLKQVKAFSFARGLKQSMARNKMLDFSRYVQIATVDADGLPSVRTVVMREIFEDKAIVVVTDKRSEKLNHLQNKHSPFAHNKAPSSSSSTDQKTNTDMTDAFDGDMTFTTKPCEVCWYFSLTKEQFRIRCKVVLIDANTKSELYQAFRLAKWQGLSAPSRQQYEDGHPGQIVESSHAALGDLDRYESQPVSTSSPSPNFVVMLLCPLRCDYLSLPTARIDKTKPIHRESVLRPCRSSKRWLHMLTTNTDQEEEWVSKELNP